MQLRRDGKPEAWRASAKEAGNGLQWIAAFLLAEICTKLCGYLFDDLYGVLYNPLSFVNCRIVPEENVRIEQILHIIREKRGFQCLAKRND